MADLKITELQPANTPVDTNLFETVESVSTTPLNKKITWTQIKAFLKSFFDNIYTTAQFVVDTVVANYVPYTNATKNIDLGGHSLKTTGTVFVGSGTPDSPIGVKTLNPRIKSTNSGNGIAASFSAYGSNGGWPRATFFVGSNSGNSINNAGFWVVPDVTGVTQKPMFLEAMTSPNNASALTKRIMLYQGLTFAKIMTSSANGNGAGTDLQIYTNGVSIPQLTLTTNGRVGISNINPLSVFDIASTTSGFLCPRMTTTQRDAITNPPTGLQIFNLTTNVLNIFNGTIWTAVGSGGGSSAGMVYLPVSYALSGSRTHYQGFEGSSVEATAQYISPADVKISNLYIKISGTQPSDGSLVFIFRKNGADTPVSVTINPGDSTGFYSDTLHSFSVVAGDLLDLKIINNSASPSARYYNIVYKIS